ncbi:hypothetical protein ACQP2C_27665 [Micromonospora zamorensis]
MTETEHAELVTLAARAATALGAETSQQLTGWLTSSRRRSG